MGPLTLFGGIFEGLNLRLWVSLVGFYFEKVLKINFSLGRENDMCQGLYPPLTYKYELGGHFQHLFFF